MVPTNWSDQSNTGTWSTLLKTTILHNFKNAHINNEKTTSGTLFLGDSYILFENATQKYSYGLESGLKIDSSDFKVKGSKLFSRSEYYFSLMISKNGVEMTKIIFEEKHSALEVKSFLERTISNLGIQSAQSRSAPVAASGHSNSLSSSNPQAISQTTTGRQIARGMKGIAQKKENLRLDDDKNIDTAFSSGLAGLERAAKEMIQLSKKISDQKIGKTGAISADESVQLRNHLMTLGLEEAGDTEQSDLENFTTNEDDALFQKLKIKAQESGNFLLLSDVFCIVNRIKGIDLISPEDTLKFVSTMVKKHNSQCKLIKYDTGAMALEFINYTSGSVNNSIEKYFDQAMFVVGDDFEFDYLTAEILNRYYKIPILVATERLKQAEKEGFLCIDYSIEGLRYFRNLFV